MKTGRQPRQALKTGSASNKDEGPSQPEGKTSAAKRIARELGEDQPNPCLSISRIVSAIGVERTDELVRQSKEVEAAGGMMIPDGSRRRTLGGVFFKLFQDTASEEERYTVWPWRRPMTVEESRERRRLHRKTWRARKRQKETQSQPMSWQACRELVDEALKKGRGVASTMKMTVVGRPGPVLEQGPAIVTVLEGAKVPTLPRGLPTPDKMPSCAVIISAKQWEKVASVLENEQDALVIQGVPTIDPGFNGITMLATSVTTKLLDKAKREKNLIQGPE